MTHITKTQFKKVRKIYGLKTAQAIEERGLLYVDHPTLGQATAQADKHGRLWGTFEDPTIQTFVLPRSVVS